MERLPGRRKYLGANIGYTIFLGAYYHLLQKIFGEVNNDFPTNQFHFINKLNLLSGQKPQSNKSVANQLKLMILASTLKRVILSIFISFMTLSQQQTKSYISYQFDFSRQFDNHLKNLDFSSIFQFFPLGIGQEIFFNQIQIGSLSLYPSGLEA